MPTDVLEIYINSRTATQYFNNLISDSMYSLPVIEINKDEKAYICVKNAVIANSFYNVNNTNNKLNFILEDDTLSITIPNGNYNINTFRTQLYDILFNLDYGPGNTNHKYWIITYIPKLNKMVYTHQYHNFSFLSTSSCFELMGFKDGASYTSNNLSLTSTISCNSNIICSIPVQGASGSFLFYEDNQRHLVHNVNNLTNFKLKLSDEDGDLIDFNDVHYSLTLEISIVS